MSIPDLSIIIPTYNRLPLLKEALASFVAKSWVLFSVPDQTEEKRAARQKLARKVYATFHFPRRWKPVPRAMDPEHFWELGHGGLSAEDVIGAANAHGLTVAMHFRNNLFGYHHFFCIGTRH